MSKNYVYLMFILDVNSFLLIAILNVNLFYTLHPYLLFGSAEKHICVYESVCDIHSFACKTKHRYIYGFEYENPSGLLPNCVKHKITALTFRLVWEKVI